MILLTEFTVLIERAALRHRLRALALRVLALAIAAAAIASGAQAQVAFDVADRKLARELRETLHAPRTPSVRWARDVRGVRHVQAVVVTDGADPTMSALREYVLRSGGSVHAVFPALNALTVQVRANQLQALARRSEVVSVSPNREVRRTASVLEAVSGALESNVRSNSTKTSYTGYDGTGIGIAVLDSGVMRTHKAFLNGIGVGRVKKSVTMLNTALANWTTGVEGATSLVPGSAALLAYELQINNELNSMPDAYGHGTHVAAVAAGRPRFFSAGTPDTSGIAPNADIYDVKVLNDEGTGTLSDVLEGIQWVIYHAREYNIRVMNLSLAAGSSESWLNDPLTRAARSAVAAGITVVAAAGNYGLSIDGREVYGAVGSPGHDPSVITVGSANFRGTVTRADDLVNRFSSRGPTRGARFVNGVRQADNLLKPDLVAPGNRIVAAAATQASIIAPTWNRLARANYDALVVTC